MAIHRSYHRFVINVTDTAHVNPAGMNPHRILIAGSRPTLREALNWLLEEESELEVVGEAGSGIDVLSKAKSLAPDVVILDVELPELDGYGVTRVLKRLPHAPFVILLLVNGDPSARRHGQAAGADGFIEISSDWLTLLPQIRALLNMS